MGRGSVPISRHGGRDPNAKAERGFLDAGAFPGINPTDEEITSELPVIRQLCRRSIINRETGGMASPDYRNRLRTADAGIGSRQFHVKGVDFICAQVAHKEGRTVRRDTAPGSHEREAKPAKILQVHDEF